VSQNFVIQLRHIGGESPQGGPVDLIEVTINGGHDHSERIGDFRTIQEVATAINGIVFVLAQTASVAYLVDANPEERIAIECAMWTFFQRHPNLRNPIPGLASLQAV